MLFRAQPSDPWEPFDFALIEAYQTMKDETCPQCGHPLWLCRSNSNVIHFKVKNVTCNATRALERYKDDKKKGKDKASPEEKKNWGTSFYTEVDLLPLEKEAGTPMPTRKDYFDSLPKEGT